MPNAVRTRYVAECYWAGVQERDLRDLDRRVDGSIAAMPGSPGPVRYLGRVGVLDDEVVLLLLEGPSGAVRSMAERAGIPFERLLQVSLALRPDHFADSEVST